MSEEKHNLQRQADRTKPNSKRSVISYLIIMFAAAIILLLMAYLMQQRTNEQAIDGLQQSMSAMQSAQELYEENGALKEQLDEQEDQIRLMQEKLDRLTEQTEDLQQELKEQEALNQQQSSAQAALDWFWQINEAYVRGRHSLCRDLIESLTSAGLQEYLPKESITANERFSPYDRYQEIYDALY